MSRMKLCDGYVIEIIDLFTYHGASQPQLAKWYGVTPMTISNILNRRTWRDVEIPGLVEKDLFKRLSVLKSGVGNNNASILTKRKVDNIRRAYLYGGWTQAALARKYGVTQPNICMIVRRKTWAHIPDPEK